MKTVLAVLAVAAITGSAGFAAGESVTPAQFRALSKRVTKVEKVDNTLVQYVGVCLGTFVPLTVYGGGSGGDGYVYQPPAGAPTFLVSAVDVTGQGDTASFYVPGSQQDCTLKAAEVLRTIRAAHPDFRIHVSRQFRPVGRIGR
jgi:hypothetical protein